MTKTPLPLLSVQEREQIAAAETLVGWMTRVWNRADHELQKAYLQQDIRDRLESLAAHPDHAFSPEDRAEVAFLQAALAFIEAAQQEWAVFRQTYEGVQA